MEYFSINLKENYRALIILNKEARRRALDSRLAIFESGSVRWYDEAFFSPYVVQEVVGRMLS